MFRPLDGRCHSGTPMGGSQKGRAHDDTPARGIRLGQRPRRIGGQRRLGRKSRPLLVSRWWLLSGWLPADPLGSHGRRERCGDPHHIGVFRRGSSGRIRSRRDPGTGQPARGCELRLVRSRYRVGRALGDPRPAGRLGGYALAVPDHRRPDRTFLHHGGRRHRMDGRTCQLGLGRCRRAGGRGPRAASVARAPTRVRSRIPDLRHPPCGLCGDPPRDLVDRPGSFRSGGRVPRRGRHLLDRDSRCRRLASLPSPVVVRQSHLGW